MYVCVRICLILSLAGKIPVAVQNGLLLLLYIRENRHPISRSSRMLGKEPNTTQILDSLQSQLVLLIHFLFNKLYSSH